MKRYLFHVAVILSFLSLSFQKPKEQRITLWDTGFVHTEEVVGKTGQVWYGLFETNHGFEFRRTKVTVKDSSNGLHNSFVAIDQPGKPLFLVRGGRQFTEGPVQTCFHGYQFIKPSQQLTLKMSGEWTFVFIGAGKEDGEYIRNYSLTLFHNQAQQLLLSLTAAHVEGAYPTIRWVGDADRDNKPDLLIDLGRKNGSRLALFLSSAANQGEFLRQVAVFERTGC
jgi:hypothetical protein